MSEKGAIKKSTAQAICDAVKVKEGTTEGVPFKDVAERILALPTPSGENKFAQLVDGSITEVTAEDLEGITEIMVNTFYKRMNLAKVTLSDSVKKIGETAFYNCSNLTEIQVNSLEELGATCFDSCIKLEEFIAPNVKRIGNAVFQGCSKLRVLKLTNPDLTLNNVRNLIYDTYDLDMYFSLPLENIYCFNSTQSIGIFGGALRYRIFINNELVENAVFPNTVTKLTRNGIRQNSGFKTVTFLGDMKEISDWGFAECGNLEKISFPNCTSVPILKGTSLLYQSNKVSAIEVPAALYDKWIASTNWSSSGIASKIVAI